MFEETFKYKTANVNKLKSYGFKLNDKAYEFKTDILNGEFELYVFVSSGGKVSTKVCEKDTGEEYILYLVESAVGEFVGKVRAAVENALTDISANCFDREIFKSEQAKELIKYVQNKYGDELEYLWGKFPNNAF